MNLAQAQSAGNAEGVKTMPDYYRCIPCVNCQVDNDNSVWCKLDWRRCVRRCEKFALAAGNAGIQSAYQHSLFENPEWDTAAKSFLHWYCETHAEVFIEDATRMYSGLGYAEPAESRAWGQIVRFAKKQKWISSKPCGAKQRTLGHGSFGPTWESLIYRGES